jgi:predicted ribosomally synthesized peptide with nif11-like leader
MDQRLVEKAKEAKSAKELAVMAHEEGIDLSDVEADRYYASLHSSEHELSDEELNNVAGGGCAETEQEKAKKYEMHKADDTCGDHSWSYMVYTGVVAIVLMPGGRQCSNCHYALGSDKESPSGGTFGYFYCALHTK